MLEKDYNLPLYEILDILSYISVEEQGLRDFAFIPTLYSSFISVKRPKLDYGDIDYSTVYTNIIHSATFSTSFYLSVKDSSGTSLFPSVQYDNNNSRTAYINIIPSATFSTISYPLVKGSTGASSSPSAEYNNIDYSTIYTNIIFSATFGTISYSSVKASTGTSLFPSAAGGTLTSLLNSRLGYFPSRLYPR